MYYCPVCIWFPGYQKVKYYICEVATFGGSLLESDHSEGSYFRDLYNQANTEPLNFIATIRGVVNFI